MTTGTIPIFPDDAAWTVLFTERFRTDLERVSLKDVDRYLLKLEFLRRDPYARNNNLKPLRGTTHGFRLRIGSLRVVYRIVTNLRQVLLLRAAERQDVYQGNLENEKPAGLFENFRRQPGGASDKTISEEPASISQDAEIETTTALIDEDELDLIGIPTPFHKRILNVKDIEALRTVPVPLNFVQRIEDYLTAPSPTHIGRVYALAPQDTLPSIASAPLVDFILALDRQQREIVNRPLDGGPYMVRGGPGTGKTLIALYRLKELYQQRTAESLLDESRPYFAFTTYTRTLSSTAASTIEHLLKGPAKIPIKSSTFDSTVARLSRQIHAGRPLDVLKDPDAEKLLSAGLAELTTDLQGEALEEHTKALAIFRETFILEEIESVIYANGLSTLEEYLDFQRIGRKTPIRRKQRAALWAIFERFESILQRDAKSTWERQRLHVLRALESGRINPPRANALFVDEAQDLSPTSLRLLLNLVKDPRFLMLLGDTGQSIYRKSPVWRNISPKLRFHAGNSFVLRRSYRNTQQLEQALRPLRLDPDSESDISSTNTAVFSGPKPHWLKEPRGQQTARTIQIIANLTTKRGVNPGQIAIVVRFTKQAAELVQSISNAGLQAYLVEKVDGIKLDGMAVHVINVHSAKGLEFPFLVVPDANSGAYPANHSLKGCSDQGEKEEILEQERRLLYVALSRAARELWMLSDPQSPSQFTTLLNPEHWDPEQ